MNKDIFSVLSKYKPSQDNISEENYFTEAFAFILNRNKKILLEIIENIVPGLLIKESSLKIETQVIYENPKSKQNGKISKSIIDIKVSESNSLIFIEIKLKAELNKYKTDNKNVEIDQLEHYNNILDTQNKKNKYLFLFAFEEDINKYSENNYPEHTKLVSWNTIYKILSKQRSKKDEFYMMFTNFMKEKGMADFFGFNHDYFTSIGNSNNELILKDDFVVKEYFRQFTLSVKKFLNEKSNIDWDCYEYSIDKGAKRIYNHFYFSSGNALSLNINTAISNDCLRINLWLPLWSAAKNESKDEQGKVNQKLLKEIIYSYRKNPKELSEIFYNVFKTFNSTFSLELRVKQYEHLKSSKKKAQGMQKGHEVPIISLQCGSPIILNKKNLSLLSEPNKKEVYDNLNTPTKFFNAEKELFDFFFEYIFKDDRKKSLFIKKDLPIAFVEESKEKIVDIVGSIILDLKELIIRLNNIPKRKNAT